MPIRRLIDTAIFGPADIAALSEAYDDALRTLGLTDRYDPLCEIVAKKMMVIAQTGERNPQRLAALTIEQLGIPVTIGPDAT